METSSSAPLTVLVTGCGGYVASVLVQHLLRDARIAHVRGTVRSMRDVARVQQLRAAFPRLELHEADLLAPNSFTDACDGAHIVFHCASPFVRTRFKSIDEARTELIEPAVQGTENVMRAALAAPTVRRVVLTSSVAAIRCASKPPTHVHTENDWNESATLEATPYPLSKVLAERRAWQLIEAHKKQGGTCDLVTVNPVFVVGPPALARSDGVSVGLYRDLLAGAHKLKMPPGAINMVDVRDVARAHIEAALRHEARGRYLLGSERAHTYEETVELLRAAHPHAPLPPPSKAPAAAAVSLLSHAKATAELGFVPTALRRTIEDMATALLALGIVPTVSTSRPRL